MYEYLAFAGVGPDRGGAPLGRVGARPEGCRGAPGTLGCAWARGSSATWRPCSPPSSRRQRCTTWVKAAVHLAYQIERVRLPFPVTFRQAGIFVAVLLALAPLRRLPGLAEVPAMGGRPAGVWAGGPRLRVLLGPAPALPGGAGGRAMGVAHLPFV